MQDAVHCAQQSGPGFVVEHNDHAGGGQRGSTPEPLVHTPGTVEGHTNSLSPGGSGGVPGGGKKEVCLELPSPQPPSSPPPHTPNTPISIPCLYLGIALTLWLHSPTLALGAVPSKATAQDAHVSHPSPQLHFALRPGVPTTASLCTWTLHKV